MILYKVITGWLDKDGGLFPATTTNEEQTFNWTSSKDWAESIYNNILLLDKPKQGRPIKQLVKCEITQTQFNQCKERKKQGADIDQQINYYCDFDWTVIKEGILDRLTDGKKPNKELFMFN